MRARCMAIMYREAFARIGGDEVAAVAAEYLEDRIFGFDAALILKAISDKQLNLPEPSFHRQWPWFDEVAAARADRAVFLTSANLQTRSRPRFSRQ